MQQANIPELKRIAAAARKLLIETVHYAKAGHVGGPLSAMDMLVALYFHIMNIRPDDPRWEERDRFVLSKGHSALALYSVMAKRGYLPEEELKTFDRIDSRLQGHPDMNVLPGLDMSTGSLGQGISAAVGMALGAKLQGRTFTTYCMVGDGEVQEGQVWEAADVAVRYGLDNLIVLMDYNKLQQFGWAGEGTARLAPIADPEKKWQAFGWNVLAIDGHDFQQIIDACAAAKAHRGTPTVIVAHTVKGKGVSFMENEYLWHSRIPTDAELALALEQLSTGGNDR
ncbi:transketolase [Paenibacillus ginsengihumi]|uniref:transketolase n=1 Tax=Paenibacillus ginsengihumi TaxID=431596 RepID=UPI0003771CE2|nr:transketolase [Paenibacillus ginsengihumi]